MGKFALPSLSTVVFDGSADCEMESLKDRGSFSQGEAWIDKDFGIVGL